jgi:hypothetical protein
VHDFAEFSASDHDSTNALDSAVGTVLSGIAKNDHLLFVALRRWCCCSGGAAAFPGGARGCGAEVCEVGAAVVFSAVW